MYIPYKCIDKRKAMKRKTNNKRKKTKKKRKHKKKLYSRLVVRSLLSPYTQNFLYWDTHTVWFHDSSFSSLALYYETKIFFPFFRKYMYVHSNSVIKLVRKNFCMGYSIEPMYESAQFVKKIKIINIMFTIDECSMELH